jgi:hypothetical protein
MQSVWIDNYNQINLYKNSNTKLKLMRFEWLQLQLAIIFFFLPSSQVLEYRWLLRDITCYLIIFSYPRLKYFEHRCLLRDITYLIIFSYPRLKYFEYRCLLRDITCYLIFFSYPRLKYLSIDVCWERFLPSSFSAWTVSSALIVKSVVEFLFDGGTISDITCSGFISTCTSLDFDSRVTLAAKILRNEWTWEASQVLLQTNVCLKPPQKLWGIRF